MILRSVRHRGLRQLIERNSTRLPKKDLTDRLRGIVTALVMAEKHGRLCEGGASRMTRSPAVGQLRLSRAQVEHVIGSQERGKA